ncbi:PIN domain-containing protein [Moraxella oblonga]|uniref:PIN domain-containing protein n=1 Tax=Moraxella oblonga TaxID=200413 RepID=UPI0008352335|nr:type II toxin-antitoxin system VapC family toxin [Moraxella oblonga]
MANKIGIDTNVLVRYIAQDDETQAKIAGDFLENLTLENQGFVNNIVIVETIWVLTRVYKKTRAEMVIILETLFSSSVLIFENLALLWEVLAIYKNTKADFSDLLICKINQMANCQLTVTFDETAFKQAGMVSLTTYPNR